MAFDLATARPADAPTPAPAAPATGGFDLGTARPVSGPTARAAPARPAEDPTSFGNLVGAATEPLLQMGTGAFGAVAGGLSGFGAAINQALGFGSGVQPGDQVRHVQDALTYTPKTTGGKNAMQVIGYPFQKLGEFAKYAGEKTQDVTGSPGLATQAETALNFIPQLLASKGAGALLERPPTTSARMTPQVQELVDRNIPLTPGQLMGPGWSKAESAAERIPILGSPIRAAKAAGIEAFNRSAIQDSLDALGQQLPPDMKGSAAIAHTRKAFNQAYDDALLQTSGDLNSRPAAPAQPPGTALTAPGQLPPPPAPQGPSLAMEIDSLKQLARSSNMAPAKVAELENILNNEVLNRFQQGGLAGGETLQLIKSKLTKLAKQKANSEDYDVQQQGAALTEANAALRRMIDRENPQVAATLRDIDKGYAKFKIAQDATGKPGTGANEGVFTPSQYDSAVWRADKTKDKRAYSEVDANQQDLSRAGKGVISERLPDSGTPYQVAFLKMLLGAGGHMLMGPQGVAAAAVPFMYSRPGLAAMQRLILNPPNGGRGAAMQAPFAFGEDQR